jgi:formylglycine-generating enzyme required for sulfatase activity
VAIPGGQFISGLEMERIPEGYRAAGDWVMITRGRPHARSAGPFRMDLYEVTNAEYARFVRATGHRAPKHWRGPEPPPEINDHPVTNVSESDGAAYAKWVGKRLPSADEWEKAARGDTRRAYPWGDVFNSDNANTLEAGIGKTTPVRAFPQDLSPYGVIGLGGNVTEWTSTVSDDPEYEGCFVVCGGSYLEMGQMVSLASFRRLSQEDALGADVGFRCVKETR